MFTEAPNTVLTAKELTSRFSVGIKTIRTDLQRLVGIGQLRELPIDKRTTGYARVEDFEDKIKNLQ